MIETILKKFVDIANRYIWESPEQMPWLVVLLLGTGIFITFRLGWINIKYFKHAIDVIRGKYDNPEDKGDINHFKALATALSATVGVGNIAGVALGIHYGGPGVLFWLWVSGIFGMCLKFAECTLSMKYRTFDKKGNASGGPMYSIKNGLGKNWAWMGGLFAILTIVSSFGIGSMNQSNTVAVSFASDFHIPGWIIGIVLAGLVGLVILGGIKRIGSVASRLMPAMALIYILSALFILFSRITELPQLFITIIREAFNPTAAFGGTAVGMFSLTMLWGIKRALFSNEAGMGSAPIAHAAAKTKEPVREGVVAMIGPFIDTLLICTLTGLVIISTDVWSQKKLDTRPLDLNKLTLYETPDYNYTDKDLHDENIEQLNQFNGHIQIFNGKAPGLLFEINDALIENPLILHEGHLYSGMIHIQNKMITNGGAQPIHLKIQGNMLQNSSAMTAWAFYKGFSSIGNFGNYIVTLCVLLFAFSTMISWSYYGDRCVEYLWGVKYIIYYRIIFVLTTYLGAILALETVWAYGDMALGLMIIPNLISVLLLSPKVVTLTKDYFKRMHTQIQKA